MHKSKALFLAPGVLPLGERGAVWNNPLSKDFGERRGGPGPVIAGSNTGICQKGPDVPQGLKDSIRSTNPTFIDLVNFDFRPVKNSPLAGAGAGVLPKGRLIDLAGKFEPQRDIPTDLEPGPRRKTVPPSVGPFETLQ